MAKTRFDYSLVGLAKKDGVTTFDGKGIETLNTDANNFLANYGLFVVLTRTLAGHEKDSINEKKDHIRKEWNWLVAGCPKRTKNTAASKVKTMQEQYDADAETLAGLETALSVMKDKTGKETLAGLIGKIKTTMANNLNEITKLRATLSDKEAEESDEDEKE